MHFNPQLFKVSIIQTKQFGPLDFELSRFHCICIDGNFERYVNGSQMSEARYINGVGFEMLGHTSVPK